MRRSRFPFFCSVLFCCYCGLQLEAANQVVEQRRATIVELNSAILSIQRNIVHLGPDHARFDCGRFCLIGGAAAAGGGRDGAAGRK